MRSGEIWQNGKRQEETFDILSKQVGKMKKKRRGLKFVANILSATKS